MSAAAERRRGAELPPQWGRLERVAQEAAAALSAWRRRALEAEEEVVRLRRSLEELATARSAQPIPDLRDEVRRLRAENAALHSRMIQARKRVAALMKRLVTLGIEP